MIESLSASSSHACLAGLAVPFALRRCRDPNEPRYCICNQVSYGDMVACDNADCPYEWFHYPCVGVTAPPKGKWYCQPCLASMRRRGRKYKKIINKQCLV